MQVQIITNTEWIVQARGMTITVEHFPDAPEYRKWRVLVDNASSRAWGNGRAMACRNFPTVEDVEAGYKSLRGFSLAIGIPSNCIPFRKVA